jgi:hypothetical protein
VPVASTLKRAVPRATMECGNKIAFYSHSEICRPHLTRVRKCPSSGLSMVLSHAYAACLRGSGSEIWQQLVYSWFLRILVFKIKRAESPLLPELLKTLYQIEFTRCRGRDLALLPHEKSCRAHQAVVLSRGTTRGHSECWITGTERPPRAGLI